MLETLHWIPIIKAQRSLAADKVLLSPSACLSFLASGTAPFLFIHSLVPSCLPHVSPANANSSFSSSVTSPIRLHLSQTMTSPAHSFTTAPAASACMCSHLSHPLDPPLYTGRKTVLFVFVSWWPRTVPEI